MISIDIPIGLFCLLSGVILIMDYGRKPVLKFLGIAGVFIGLTSFFHCCVSSDDRVPYKIARGYFVRNDVSVCDIPKKIDNSYALDKFFGTAAIMGPEGHATQIDFSKETIIPIVLPATDTATEIKVNSCSEDKEAFIVKYKVITGQKQTFTMTPMALVIVKKLDYNTKVGLVKE